LSRGTTGPRWAEITAVFGGRFDPPHIGHREAVRGLFENPGVRAVKILPAAVPPHKAAFASWEHRVEMTRLAFHPPFPHEAGIDLREADLARAHPGTPTYSYETLSEMRREYGDRLAFVIGTDQLEQLRTWYHFPELLGLCHWIVLSRAPDGDAQGRKTLAEWEASGLATQAGDRLWQFERGPGGGKTFLTLVPTPARACSSTAIREAIARGGQPPEEWLPEQVSTYLKKHQLYGSESSSIV
jgi:nicotinate-nucleotide adenylyltransferase